MKKLFAQRKFLLVYNSTHNSLKACVGLRRYTAAAVQNTSNMAAVTVSDKITLAVVPLHTDAFNRGLNRIRVKLVSVPCVTIWVNIASWIDTNYGPHTATPIGRRRAVLVIYIESVAVSTLIGLQRYAILPFLPRTNVGRVTMTTESSINTCAWPLTNQTLNLILTVTLLLTACNSKHSTN